MKKKILFFTFLTTLLGVVSFSAPSAYASTPEVQQTSEETNSPYFRKPSLDLIEQGSFEYGGLSYTVTNGNKLTASAVTNPEEVTELILYYSFYNGSVTYSSIDWTSYTHLENVVAVGSCMFFCKDILAALPTGVNLYATATDFGFSFASMPFENIYLYYNYQPTYGVNHYTFIEQLPTGIVKNIYVDEEYYKANSGSINSFNNAAHTNKNGESITVTSFKECKYPKEVFDPIPDWNPVSTVFETTGYWRCLNQSPASVMSSFTFQATQVDPRVRDIYLPDSRDTSPLVSFNNYNTIYMPNNRGYSFSNIIANELIIRGYNSYNDYFNLNSMKHIKAIRFLSTSTTVRVADNFTFPEDCLLTKIYIPQNDKENYANIINHEQLKNLIEYYDEETYVFPTNSYEADDGNIYGVRDGSYTIEKLEQWIEVLNTLQIPVQTGDVIDDMMNKYELPMEDISSLTPEYSLRAFDTLVLPKNLDATKVLDAFKFILVLNHGQMSDGEGLTLDYDTTNYKVGYNGILPITVTLPDQTKLTRNITVKVIPTEEDFAYALDKNDVYIITNLTNETTKSIPSLMNPLMENYLMETSVEYEESPILNTFDGGYFAGNSYSATLTNGKVKLVCSDVDLTEETTTPNPPEEPTEENDGYVMKEILKIYTPETLDGSRFMSQMRDFLCTKDGKSYNDFNFGIGTNAGRTNKENYIFTAIVKFSEAYTYDEKISVEIIPSKTNIGYVEFRDGDIAILFNYNERYTKEQVEIALKEFLTSKNLSSENITLPRAFTETKTYEGTYANGKLYIVNSGVNLTFSTSTKPVDQTNLKQGYIALNQFIYTKGYTKEEVLRALGKIVLLKDGKQVKENYTVEYTTKENSKDVEAIFKLDDKEILKTTFHLQEIESDIPYIFTRATSFDTGYLILSKQEKNPTYTLNDVMKEVISSFRTLLVPFETKETIDFTKDSTKTLEGTYPLGNGSYYAYEYTIEVEDIKKSVETNDVMVDGKAAPKKEDSIFNNFKDNFENNPAFKTMSIILGTILGLVLIYVIYLIIHKLYKWLKK